MATLLYRLGRTAYRRWPLFLAAWLVAMVGVGAVAATMSKPYSDAFSIPGIPSEEAADLQAELFPGTTDAFDQANVNVVVAAPEGHTLSEPAYRTATDDLVSELRAAPQMPTTEEAQPTNPVDAPADVPEEFTTLSEDGRVGIISFAFDVDTVTDVEPATQEGVQEIVAEARDSGLVAEINGPGMRAMQGPGGAAELIGIAVALMVLVLTFGALISAGMPIVTALIGVGLGSSGVLAMTAFIDLPSSTPMLASMIGLAVGIDYTLFILARYRAELENTDDREEAAGVAVGTAGSAVLFAGLTVLIALAALSIVRIPSLTAMGLSAAATVMIAVAVALTLLPALLGLLKSWTFRGRVRTVRPAREADGSVVNNGVRWARLVGRAPIAVVLLVVIGLSALAVPLQGLHLAFPSDSTAASDTTQRKAADLIADGFGKGRDAPMLVVVDGRGIPAELRERAYDEIAAWAGTLDGARSALVAATNEDKTGAQVMVTPEHGSDDPRTENLLTELRDGTSAIEARTDAELGVTGLNAIMTDMSERLSDALPVYLAVVIGLAFMLLTVVFRSILVPLTATLGFLLSVLATLGATVAIFQEGTLGIMEGQPIVSFMPIFLIGLVFGLAMDYQVFLVTRMREAHVHGMSTRDAVVDGFRNSARVVSAAAVIMISVFAAFMMEDDPVVKSMGFALAVAVFLDAFVVRMALIPALMYLIGEKAWWLPGWLDRILPNVDVEGESLLAHRTAPAAAARRTSVDEDRVLV